MKKIDKNLLIEDMLTGLESAYVYNTGKKFDVKIKSKIDELLILAIPDNIDMTPRKDIVKDYEQRMKEIYANELD